MSHLQTLRAVSLTEGVSFLVLLLIAMPLKYIWHWPLAVKYVGWAHGVLFIALGALALNALLRGLIPFKTAVLLGIAALLPGGPFFADRLLREPRDRISGDACRS